MGDFAASKKPPPSQPPQTISVTIGVSPAIEKFLDRLAAVLESSSESFVQKQIDAAIKRLDKATQDTQSALDSVGEPKPAS